MFRKNHFLFLILLLLLLISACLPVSSIPTAQQPAEEALLPTATVPLSDVTTLPTVTATEASTGTSTVINSTEWSTYKNTVNGISFTYPGNWQLVTVDDDPAGQYEFGFVLRPPSDAGVDPYTAQIGTNARVVAKEQESSLYLQAGDSFLGTGDGAPETHIVWSRTITAANGYQWHVYIAGFRDSTGPWEGLEYLSEKGSITHGTFVAVHYIATKELALSFSQELDRDMVIAIDEQGADVIFPTHVLALAGVLESVSITE